MFTIAFISFELAAQLGLAGVAIVVLSKLLFSSRKDVKEANKMAFDEINKRDENFNKLQERTLEVLIVVQAAMEQNKNALENNAVTIKQVLEKLNEKENE